MLILSAVKDVKIYITSSLVKKKETARLALTDL